MPSSSDLLQSLTASRDAFQAALANVEPRQLSQRPQPDAWSPLLIAEHVVVVEEQMITFAARQAAAGEQRKEIGEPDEARIAGVLQAVASDMRIKVPESVAVHPAGGLSSEDLVMRWTTSRERMEALVESFPDELRGVALLKHPMAGPMTLEHTLLFLDAHVRHHIHQLKRAADALSSSPPSD